MKNKCFLLIAMIAIVAFSGCKQDENEAQKKIVITGITDYNNLNMELSLYKVEFNDALSPEATASAVNKSGTATFAMLKDDGSAFTDTGFFYPMLSVFDANGLDYGAGAGTTTLPVFISRETTTIKFSDFTFKGL